MREQRRLPVDNRVDVGGCMLVSCVGLSLSLSDHSLWEKSTMESLTQKGTEAS